MITGIELHVLVLAESEFNTSETETLQQIRLAMGSPAQTEASRAQLFQSQEEPVSDTINAELQIVFSYMISV